jgi:hypothetical protein
LIKNAQPPDPHPFPELGYNPRTTSTDTDERRKYYNNNNKKWYTVLRTVYRGSRLQTKSAPYRTLPEKREYHDKNPPAPDVEVLYRILATYNMYNVSLPP